MRLLAWLAACEGGASGDASSIDTTDLWPVADGRYHVFRHTDAAAEAPDTGTAPEQLVFLRWEDAQGCGGTAWRVEMRQGVTWDSGSPLGALHFDASGGLALCAYEEAGAAEVALDPAIPLWTDAALSDGDTLEAGAWSVTVRREQDLATYYGVFPLAVSFAMTGGGGPVDGWVLSLAPEVGPVLLDAPEFTADLVYFR